MPFLPLFCNWQFRRLGSIQLPSSDAHIPAGWRLETRLTLFNSTFLYNHFARTMHITQPFYCWEGVFTAPLHSNGCSIVACIFVAAEMCLPILCLAMNIYSDFTLPAFEHHVKIYIRKVRNRVKIADRCASWKISNCAENLVFRRCTLRGRCLSQIPRQGNNKLLHMW
jgi:hypothetical protein